MRDAPRSRQRAVLTFVAIVVCIGSSFVACSDVKRVTGEACIKDDDCVTGICSGQLCATAPPMLPSGVGYGEGGTGSSSGGSGSSSGGGGTNSGAADTGSSDSASDGDGPPATRDSAVDVIDASIIDAGADGPGLLDALPDGIPDVVPDVPLDVGEDVLPDVKLDVSLPG